ncbi:glutamate synthase (NADPH/NADH) small chain [Clostridium algifaecis]|uniref:Glutamate synthase (NADPH/NADH) small chain n=1 Tax=Clostridium algifaecis TaxID=1472040 RepID=A0ABS4KTS1_9CLOT|nr:NAD(P)-dependent oxidoreductase [Clostridium algifaecis]MBP2033453.1 glutamate synthase (NADPH/NADH) small chain [Clostridium algifaecis]
MGEFVIEEAKRCLQCKKPMCREGCPVNTPVNEVMKLFLEGNIIEAGEKLFKNNPLSVVCSLVCPHENQCEGHCVMGRKSNPIQISSVENYISNYYLNFITSGAVKKINKKVAIIGSGPAGITIAFILADKGYDITIFEAHDKIGGVLRYGIPDFRLPNSVLEKLEEKLVSMGIKIRPNTLIGSVITIDDLFRDEYKAVFIGTGVWKSRALGIKGETLGHVHYAIDYLKKPDAYKLGNRVCIIGGGNVAMDAARIALRNGSREVYIMYRRGPGDIQAGRTEVEYARIDGVKFEYYKVPVEIIGEGIKYARTEIVKDENGKAKVVKIEGSEDIFKADSIIIAAGQVPRANIVSSTKGIEVNAQGLVVTDELGRTTREGVFASGDVVTGAKTVVAAVRVSKLVAQAIEGYITQSCEVKSK